MNRKQRLRNRATAAQLHRQVQAAQPCPECGEPCEGGHWITTRHVTLEDEVRAHHTGVALNPDDFGFWTCKKFYEPDSVGDNGEVIPGRRKAEFINPRFTGEGAMAEAAAALLGLTGMSADRVAGMEREDGDVEAFTRGLFQGLPGVSKDFLDRMFENCAKAMGLPQDMITGNTTAFANLSVQEIEAFTRAAQALRIDLVRNAEIS